MIRFVRFEGIDGKPVHVNAFRVTTVKPRTETVSRICFNGDDCEDVVEAAEVVVRQLVGIRN